MSRAAKTAVVAWLVTSVYYFHQYTLRSAMKGCDYVFHLAALWLGECVSQPRSALEVNVVGTYNVIEACKELGVKRCVYSSSASVYGDAVSEPDRARTTKARTSPPS